MDEHRFRDIRSHDRFVERNKGMVDMISVCFYNPNIVVMGQTG